MTFSFSLAKIQGNIWEEGKRQRHHRIRRVETRRHHSEVALSSVSWQRLCAACQHCFLSTNHVRHRVPQCSRLFIGPSCRITTTEVPESTMMAARSHSRPQLASSETRFWEGSFSSLKASCTRAARVPASCTIRMMKGLCCYSKDPRSLAATKGW